MKTKLIICGLFCLLAATSVKAADNKVGINLYESGMIGAAKAFFLDNLKQQQEGVLQAETCYYLGECYLVLGLRDSAGIYYQKGIEFMPDYSYNRIGLVGLKLGKDVNGEELFKEVFTSKKDKKDAGVQLAIARAYLYAGNMTKAMEYGIRRESWMLKVGCRTWWKEIFWLYRGKSGRLVLNTKWQLILVRIVWGHT